MPEQIDRHWRTEKVRRPWVQMDAAFQQLRSEMESLNPGLEMHAGGSHRRRAATVGDLDMVIVTPNGKFVPDLLHDFPAICFPDGNWQRDGEKIVMGDLEFEVPKVNEDGTLSSFFTEQITIHIDFWACSPSERGAFLWFITGPMELNVAMRSAAVQKGMSLSQNGLFVREFEDVAITRGPNKGRSRQELRLRTQLDDGTEESVAKLLGWPMLTPQERESWAKPKDRVEKISVPSSKGGKTYEVTVDRSAGKASCTCTGYKYRQHCKHVTMALEGKL